ncbi:BTAD domain-containing putative transcriptional regulator [Saccharomonospora azurea]|uniref:AfsR/SARP family transcriptional regulator n=1 Tax=Saccharomonospora azurea TaxID=40988 RepID=UPI0033280494
MGDTLVTTHANFRLLGRLEVVIERRNVPIIAAKHRVLLATLLLHPNEVVRNGKLAVRLWGDNPPRTIKPTLQKYVQRLRKVLDTDDRIVTSSTGYLIRIDSDELDLVRFRKSVTRAISLTDPAERVGVLRQALNEWHGQPLMDIPSELLQHEELPLLEEERFRALEMLFEAELHLGNHRTIIRELQRVVRERPLDERFCGQLMLALYRAGRQAEAFAAYYALKTTLAEQLGIDPGTELQQLYAAILANAPSVAAPRQVLEPSAPAAVHVPSELPADIGGFVGREEIAKEIQQLIEQNERNQIPIALISGAPGIGKTAIAVHIGHRVADSFPDGQLYADLHGHSNAPAATPSQVQTRFLSALGVPSKEIPTDADSLTALYRTTLATRRVLILLDNAASAQQIRPLLPNAPGCAVLITSRRELRGLVALQGATPFRPGVLEPCQSFELLAGTLGHDRVRAEPEATEELAELCGHLPLALRIASANLTARSSHSVAEFVAEVLAGNRLRSLEIPGDTDAAVRTAFELSYASLDEAAATMFRVLGLFPGQHVSVEVAAALAGVSTEQAAQALDQLNVANLIRTHSATHYALHDLLRLYAGELAAKEPKSINHQARQRMYTFYLRRILAAADLLYPPWLRLPVPNDACIPPTTEFRVASDATTWMDAECLNVLAAIESAVTDGFTAWAWPMAEAMHPYLVTAGRYQHEGLRGYKVALQAAIVEGDLAAQAAMQTAIASLSLRHARLTSAEEHLHSALKAYRTIDSIDGVTRTLIALGNLTQAKGKLEEAADLINEGLSMVRRSGNERLRRFGLLNLGFVDLHRGNLNSAEDCVREVLDHSESDREQVSAGEASSILGSILLMRGQCRQAIDEFTGTLERYRQRSLPHYEANVFRHIADAHRQMGDWARAKSYADKSYAMARSSGAKDEEAEALICLATTHRVLGKHREADEQFERALAICEQNGVWRGLAPALLGCAEKAKLAGDSARARALTMRALAVGEESGLRTVRGRALSVLALLDLEAGEVLSAEKRANTAVAIHERTGSVSDLVDALCVQGTVLAARGSEAAAHNSRTTARSLLAATEGAKISPLWTWLSYR